MKKILFILSCVLFIACEKEDDPKKEGVLLELNIPTEIEFRGADLSIYADRIKAYIHQIQPDDKIHLWVTILNDGPIPETTSAITCIATLNDKHIWELDPPIVLPQETSKVKIDAIYVAGNNYDNSIDPKTPHFRSYPYPIEIVPNAAIDVSFFPINGRILFTGAGKGKRIWFSDSWKKTQIKRENYNFKTTLSPLVPDYIETDANGEAVVYANLANNVENHRFAITETGENRPAKGDEPVWNVLPVKELTNTLLRSGNYYNYIVDCSGHK